MISDRLADRMDEAAELLAILGNSKRLAIIGHLLAEELSVGAIAAKVALSQSALSQHLAKLRSLDLVETRRERQMIFYSCKSEAARRLVAALESIYGTVEAAREPRLRRVR
ncbi:MAG: winged helix-turn-helix transcriptional regulator [Rhizobiaceae bacterium]|nr:winged helix-turn-helix transcriptional regulator [Rhizobiaceae bacterium]